MIAVDTNVLVRLLTADDPSQTERAVKLFRNEQILIPKTVLLETEWVLRFSYKLSPEVIGTAFRRVFGLPQVRIEDPLVAIIALQGYDDGMDFADALHLASAGNAQAFATFDVALKKRAGRHAKVRLL